MAKARMLHKSISVSIQVNKMSSEARLLFTWLIAHADDEGRIHGECEYIRAVVVPLCNWSVKKVGKLLNEMLKTDLIIWWNIGEERFIQLKKWENHQQIRKDRFIPSKLPTFQSKPEADLEEESQPDDNQASIEYNISEVNSIKDNSPTTNQSAKEKLRKQVNNWRSK